MTREEAKERVAEESGVTAAGGFDPIAPQPIDWPLWIGGINDLPRTPPIGWLCPLCGTVNAPSVRHCSCSSDFEED